MKKLLCFFLVLAIFIGTVGCSSTVKQDAEVSDKTNEDGDMPSDDGSDNVIIDVCSFDTVDYDLSKIAPSENDIKVYRNGEALSGTNVRLDVGVNVFQISYSVGVNEKSCEVRIARREGYRVVFNTNGGSFVETQYVEDCAIIDGESVVPVRERYVFCGWYNESGERIDLSVTPITRDIILTARWEGPTKAFVKTYDPIEYSTSSAALNVIWKDYDNAFKMRPPEVFCTLKNTATNAIYAVRLTKTSAEFVGSSPMGASISPGEGNWTVKITGLWEDHTFTADPIDGDKYTSAQSGTAVVYTAEHYDVSIDDTAWLMTENGRLYDLAGNLTVLKGVVTLNVGWQNLTKNTSIPALTRLQKEGINSIRVTVMTGGSNGYWEDSDGETTPEKKDEIVKTLKQTINNASSIGMYCIVDWGVSMGNVASGTHAQYMKDMQSVACEFFGRLAEEYKDDPYVIYEICNEPAVPGSDGWGNAVRSFEENVTRTIRQAGSEGLIIAGPNMYARNISEYQSSDDPIEKPFSTEISYNVAYSFHCYPIQFPYDYEYRENERYNYGWRLSDAIKAGLTVVTTEFNPGSADAFPIGVNAGDTWDIGEGDKFLNVMLENDVSYMFFRYMSNWDTANTTSSQEMFIPGYNDDLNNGTWTVDIMNVSGRWFYDNAMNSTGFIKAADFSYRGKASETR